MFSESEEEGEQSAQSPQLNPEVEKREARRKRKKPKRVTLPKINQHAVANDQETNPSSMVK